MAKDYKAGLVVGLVLVIITAVWLSIHPSLSVGSRLKDLNEHQEPKPDLSQIIKENGNQNNSIKPADKETTIPENEESPAVKTEQEIDNEQGSEIYNDFSIGIDVSSILGDNETKYHKVAQYDTLIKLAKQYYGSENLWTTIRDANPHIDVYDLKPGTTLIIPPR